MNTRIVSNVLNSFHGRGKKGVYFLSVFLLLLMTAGVTFHNSIDNPFCIDDHGLIFADKMLQSWKYLKYYFFPDAQGLVGTSLRGSSSYYRPLAHVIPGICSWFFEKNPRGYHLINIIFLAMAGVSVFACVEELTKKRGIALMASVLFVAHPINGLMVNYITASVFAFQIMFMCWAIIFLLKWAEGEGLAAFVFTIISTIGAIWCHETAAALPIYMFAVLMVVCKCRFIEALKRLFPFLIFWAAYVLFRVYEGSLGGSVFEKIGWHHISFFEYLATFGRLVFGVLKNLVFCQDVVLGWAIMPVKGGVLWWALFFMGFFLVGMFVLLYAYFKKYAWGLWVFWFYIGFFPVFLGCLIEPQSGFLFEPHWMFFSFLGFFVLIAIFFETAFKPKAIRVGAFVAFVFYLIGMSWIYNWVWGDEIRYCSFAQVVSPSKKSMNFHIARSSDQRGTSKYSENYYVRELTGTWHDWDVFNNLGLLAWEQGDLEKAEALFHRSQDLGGGTIIPLTNLGALFKERGDLDKAIHYFEQGIQLDALAFEARLGAAACYEEQGRIREAERLLLEAHGITPRDVAVLSELTHFYLRQKNLELMDVYARQWARRLSSAEELVLAGNELAGASSWASARIFYERALKRHPKDPLVYQELGKALGNYGQFDAAIQAWQEGKKFSQDDTAFDQLIREADRLRRASGGAALNVE